MQHGIQVLCRVRSEKCGRSLEQGSELCGKDCQIVWHKKVFGGWAGAGAMSSSRPVRAEFLRQLAGACGVSPTSRSQEEHKQTGERSWDLLVEAKVHQREAPHRELQSGKRTRPNYDATKRRLKAARTCSKRRTFAAWGKDPSRLQSLLARQCCHCPDQCFARLGTSRVRLEKYISEFWSLNKCNQDGLVILTKLCA